MRLGLKEVQVLPPDGATLHQDFSIGHAVGSILHESAQVSLDEVSFSCTHQILDLIYDKVELNSWGLALVESLHQNFSRLEVLHCWIVLSVNALL